MVESDLLEQAIILQKQGDIEEAERVFNEILKKDPDNIDSLNNLAIIYNIKGDLKKSLKFISNAYEKYPTYEKIVQNYVLLLLKNDQIIEALDIIIYSIENNIDKIFLRNLTLSVLKGKANGSDQKGVMLFFDVFSKNLLNEFAKEKVEIIKDFLKPKYIRYSLFQDRYEKKCMFSNNIRTNVLSETFSQGTHSSIKWKGLSVFKSANDLALLTMIINDLRPDVVIEIGSGQGGSAIWLADIMKAANINSKVYSYDKIRPDIDHENVYFIEFDLFELNEDQIFPKKKSWKGKKLIIEDAHVNLESTFNSIDRLIENEDYLIIEDSLKKQKEIKKFVSNSKNNYYVDQFYTDFFGRNATSAVNSILKVNNN